MPAFREVLQSVVQTWQTRRDEVEAAGADVVQRLSRSPSGASQEVTAALLDQAVASLRRSYDGVHGGFGGAPKFPPSMVLELLLRHAARTGRRAGARRAHLPRDGLRRDVRPARRRLRPLLGRRAVGRAALREDAVRQRPAAARLRHLWRATGSDEARRVALETAEFLLRDLRTAEGGFASPWTPTPTARRA
jgi:uncharacterized protein YyaL (SSP411 family)